MTNHEISIEIAKVLHPNTEPASFEAEESVYVAIGMDWVPVSPFKDSELIIELMIKFNVCRGLTGKEPDMHRMSIMNWGKGRESYHVESSCFKRAVCLVVLEKISDESKIK